ncbi:hypothetical protein [Microbacterium sp. 13-71-7]|jgi:hypothetical protein|uniref:hypothetical protein n=1 Tax=Microbacterium sp. 13-71-7 TaxID=1970399 RepID=UPI000BC62773|nr:hypothetical protein [Microbacterium sp. 13-71-7]OZB85888.1 MAG: hypothetical protein B7X32_01685 [Microbacterium sp. 13-71-7]
MTTNVSLVFIAVGAAVLAIGALMMVFRMRVLRFVSGRFERVYREDDLSKHESRARMPRMWMLLIIVSGHLAFGLLCIIIGFANLNRPG